MANPQIPTGASGRALWAPETWGGSLGRVILMEGLGDSGRVHSLLLFSETVFGSGGICPVVWRGGGLGVQFLQSWAPELVLPQSQLSIPGGFPCPEPPMSDLWG